MLKSIRIKNIALISDCELEFDEGLNVLSGETGAGKSVVLDSIDFALGQKADKDLITHGESECSVTCVFEIPPDSEAMHEAENLGIETDGELVVRRTFSESGKGSIRVNGEHVTAGMLRKITTALVDVHGQSDHFALTEEKAQRELLDQLEFSEISKIKSEILEIITSVGKIREELKKVGGSESERLYRLDYLRYATNEIEAFGLKEGEEEELLLKRKKLRGQEKITAALSAAHEAVSGDGGAMDLLASASRQLSSISSFGEEYEKLVDGMNEAISALSEVGDGITDGLETEYDPFEADAIEKRLEDISALKKKYGGDYSEIMKTLSEMKEEAELISNSGIVVEKLKEKEDAEFKRLKKAYGELTLLRRRAADFLTKSIIERLRELNMKNADFGVEIETSDDEKLLSREGADSVRFMFSANAGEPKKPLSKVISGGELSRLMLAVKSVTGVISDAQTYIFDEIDSGISGVTAAVVAKSFARISRAKQVIAISHLPQIVAMSDKSLLIEKSENDGKTRTNVRVIAGEDKIREVVRLVGGSAESKAAFEHSAELIRTAEKFKSELR